MRRAMADGAPETEGAPEATGTNSEVPEAGCSTGVPPATSFSAIAVDKNHPSSSDSMKVLKLYIHTIRKTANITIKSLNIFLSL
jgi:hypothetical protein